jgi:leucyl aminopeptidase
MSGEVLSSGYRLPGGDHTPLLPGDVILLGAPGDGYQLILVAGATGASGMEALRQLGGLTAQWLLRHAVRAAGVRAADLYELGGEQAVEAYCLGLLLGGYGYGQRKSREAGPASVEVRLLVEENLSWLEVSAQRAAWIAEGVSLARDLANEPPNLINPVNLAERAESLAAQTGLGCAVLDEKRLAELGAGAILAVGQGSQAPPRLICLEYPGRGEHASSQPVVILGKALTFDTGGYTLKENAALVGMKYDKCGGAAVLGIMHAISHLQPDTPVVGVIAAAENMISAAAYRPDDVIRSMSGKTIEISSTDAEGRLVLADALTYAIDRYQPRIVIDLATLTYGVVTALGKLRAGLVCNEDALAGALLECGERTGERLWRLPLDDEYLEYLHSDIAVLKNYSGTKDASPVTGGVFLKLFVPDDLPWAHLDILGMATTAKDLPYTPKGATGFGVRLIVDYLEIFSSVKRGAKNTQP